MLEVPSTLHTYFMHWILEQDLHNASGFVGVVKTEFSLYIAYRATLPMASIKDYLGLQNSSLDLSYHCWQGQSLLKPRS